MTVGGGAFFVDSRWSVSLTMPYSQLLAFRRDGRLQAERNLTVQLNVYNLTDEYYFDSVAGAGYAIPGAGRDYSLSGAHSFEHREACCFVVPASTGRRPLTLRRRILLVHIPGVLTPNRCSHCRDVMAQPVGRRPGHGGSPIRKGETEPCNYRKIRSEARELGQMVLAALKRHPLFMSAVLPKRSFRRCSIATMRMAT